MDDCGRDFCGGGDDSAGSSSGIKLYTLPMLACLLAPLVLRVLLLLPVVEMLEAVFEAVLLARRTMLRWWCTSLLAGCVPCWCWWWFPFSLLPIRLWLRRRSLTSLSLLL